MKRNLLDTWRIHHKGDNVEALKLSIMSNLEYRLARDHHNASDYDHFLSVASAVMERVIERWMVTQQQHQKANPKRVYFVSVEYLLGRSLKSGLLNLGLYDACREAAAEFGMDLEAVCECEADAGLGNGGLGRLAACFLDSLATLDLPAWGYGIRYEFGMFQQAIVEGRQVEKPDYWLALTNPWEIERPESMITVRFGGSTRRVRGLNGKLHTVWDEADRVLAMPYDTPIPGYGTETVNTLRLWSARATEEFNLEYFNAGDYIQACERKVMSENITKVLYPADQVFVGKELRLRQEYFLVSASIQDIVRRFEQDNNDWADFPGKVAIQLNDTHPSLAIPELLRVLVDEKELDWERAWPLVTETFAYTNHTVMPEALEEWPLDMLGRMLPRHLELIYQINHYLLKEVSRCYPGDVDRMQRMSLIAEDEPRRVRMANLSVAGSHAVNGVSRLHTELLAGGILKDFHELRPTALSSKTNGITPRRWLLQANPALAGLITDTIGDGWPRDLDLLRRIEPHADDPSFREQWRAIRRLCKAPIAEMVRHQSHVALPTDQLYDVQVKRIHEYKRQLLFALYIASAYLRIKDEPNADHVPRVCLVGGKAAPSYDAAKRIIALIGGIADVVNNDPQAKRHLRVVFLPNYCVSLAEKLIPAADLSEQISTAGKEASGTGNMKFALNGAVTIGTLDGANIEILDEVGRDNMFPFGLTVDEVGRLKAEGYSPWDFINRDPMLQRVMHLLDCDFFCQGNPGLFRPIYEELTRNDHFLVLADFSSYVDCQARVSEAYRDADRWTRMSIMNTARSGRFSSDRVVREYAEEIWQAEPVAVQPVEEAVVAAVADRGKARVA